MYPQLRNILLALFKNSSVVVFLTLVKTGSYSVAQPGFELVVLLFQIAGTYKPPGLAYGLLSYEEILSPLLLFCFLCPILCSLSIVYCSLTLSGHHCVLPGIFLLNEKDQLNGLVISHLSLHFFLGQGLIM